MATNMEGLVQHRVGTQQVTEVSDGLAPIAGTLAFERKSTQCALLSQNGLKSARMCSTILPLKEKEQ